MSNYDEEYENIARNKWKKKYEQYDEKRAVYDGWYDDFIEYIKLCDDPIIDLGCGNGNNAYYLSSFGKKVIACDYTKEALELINEKAPNITTKFFDMRDGLPFVDNFTSIIIADLSLHYFNESDTFKIIDEIVRILKPNGLLLLRVNSVKDINHGSNDGEEIEKHFRRNIIDGYRRFFDRNDIEYFFNRFEILYINEEPMNGRYERDKILWNVILKCKKNK